MSGQASSGDSPAGPAGSPDAGNVPAGSAGQGAGDAGGTGTQGGGASGWLANLPETFQKAPSLQKFKGPDALAASYLELEKRLGSTVTLPQKPEEWDTFFTKAGRPESPDKYSFTKPDLGIDENLIDVTEDFEKSIRQTAHALGLNQVQFDRLLKQEAEALKSEVAESRERGKQAETQMREMWGSAMDKNLALSQRALDFYDPKGELKDLLVESGLGNHPAVIKMFYDFSGYLVNDGLIPGEVAGVLTPDAAKARIEELAKNPAYMDGGHPDHERLVQEMQGLYSLAHSRR